MNLENKAVKGVLWSFIEKWGGQLISTAVFLLLARLLGPEAFGVIALASVFIAFMSAFVNQGFAPAIIQRKDLENGHLDTAFWMSITSGCLLMLGTVLSAGLIASSFGEPKIEPVVRWLSLAFLLIALQSVQDAILRRNMAFKSLAFRSLVATSTSGVVSVILAFMGFGVWSLVAQQLINRIVNVLMLWRASSWRPGLAVSFGCLKDLLSFSVYVMGTNFLRFFNQRSDDFLIGYFLGSVTLGYYTVAYRFLLLMVNIFTNATTTVALPAFSKLQEDSERLRKAFYKATQLTSFIAFPSFSIIFVIAPELVHVMFGEKWDASIPVMQVLILAGILQSVSYFGGTVMLAKGKPNLRLGMHCLNAVTNVIGFMIAVNYGIVAVAIAFVISNYLIAPVNLIIIKRLIKISYADYFRQYTGPILSSLFMVLIVFFTRNALIEITIPFLTLSTCCIAGAISYLSAIALLDRSLANQVFKLAKQFL